MDKMDKRTISKSDRSIVEGKLRPRQWFLWVLFLVLGLGVSTVGWLAYSANAALSKISDAPDARYGGFLPFLGNQQDLLQGEKDNRINILLLGVGGAKHAGGTLTDTIMLLSIKPKEKKAALLSIPRDLYVAIPSIGSGKINSAHALGEQREPGAGPALTKTTVGTILNLPIHYYIRLDFQGFVSLVDTLGGIDVNVDKAISDPFYPNDLTDGYSPFYLKVGQTHMLGKIALKYARSRETTSDFDRSRRQQQILSAIKTKVLSLNTLANPKRVNELFGIAGDHIRTDLAVWEMERLATILKDIDTSAMSSKVLDTSIGGPLVGRTDERAGYIILPRKGNFGEIAAIALNLFDDKQSIAPATVAIENASGQANVGGNIALILRGYGYRVTSIKDATTSRAKSQLLVKDLTLYPDLTTLLHQRFNVRAQVGKTTPLASDALLIIGEDYLKTQ